MELTRERLVIDLLIVVAHIVVTCKETAAELMSFDAALVMRRFRKETLVCVDTMWEFIGCVWHMEWTTRSSIHSTHVDIIGSHITFFGKVSSIIVWT